MAPLLGFNRLIWQVHRLGHDLSFDVVETVLLAWETDLVVSVQVLLDCLQFLVKQCVLDDPEHLQLLGAVTDWNRSRPISLRTKSQVLLNLKLVNRVPSLLANPILDSLPRVLELYR